MVSADIYLEDNGKGVQMQLWFKGSGSIKIDHYF